MEKNKMNPFNAPKERELKEIYEARKKLSFEEWRKFILDRRKVSNILAIVAIGLQIFIWIMGSLGITRYYSYKLSYENYRETALNVGYRECSVNGYGKLIQVKLIGEELAIYCEDKNILIDNEWSPE